VKSSSPLPRSKKPARTKLLEGQLDLNQITPESRKHAGCVLEVLAGLRSPEQAAEALSMSLPTYYNLETRALRGLIHGCTPTPPGRTLMLLKQVRSFELQCATLQKQVGRYQALLRNAQRSAGLLPPPVEAKARIGAQRKPKRPAIRALRAIEAIARVESPPAQQPVVSATP
jgi:hypothetical protein